MSQRYAERTDVPVDRSQMEVKKRLRDAGADQIAIFEGGDRSAVAFRLEDRMYRITLPLPKGPSVKVAAQEERRGWRLLLMLIRSKLEAVREGATTIEREFLSDMLMPEGQTVGEWINPQMRLAYESGKMPGTLMLEGPK